MTPTPIQVIRYEGRIKKAEDQYVERLSLVTGNSYITVELVDETLDKMIETLVKIRAGEKFVDPIVLKQPEDVPEVPE